MPAATAETLLDVAYGALKALPEHVDEIAQVFREAGIKGFPNDECCNPVAEYIAQKMIPEASYVEVHEQLLVGVDYQEETQDITGLPVYQFLSAFNNGAYTDLEG